MKNEAYVVINDREVFGIRKWLIIAAAVAGCTLAVALVYAILTAPIWITALLL